MFRRVLATWAGRLTSWTLRNLFHREASQLPGRVGLMFDPHLIEKLARRLPYGSIVVCGTNGKTTTNNIVACALEEAGLRVVCNRVGANMAPGIAAALLSCDRADVAVLEIDELSCPIIFPELRPRYVVLLNLFRDQLDRAGEIDCVQASLTDALLASPKTTLIACGDDPLCMKIARQVERQHMSVLTFGIDEDLHLPEDRVPEARFCQECGAELDYQYRHYAQLGAFACPACDFTRAKLDCKADHVAVVPGKISCDVTLGSRAFQLGGQASHAPSASDSCLRPEKVNLHTTFGGVYMVYNLLAAFSAARLMGASSQEFQKVLDAFHPENGRLEHFTVMGRDVILNLAKNPTGFNQNIALMLSDPGKKIALFMINDNDNDGRDISWIWDVDFERLAHNADFRVFAGGKRKHDVQVRMKYAGIAAETATSVSEVLKRLDEVPTSYSLYVLTNYSALWPARSELKQCSARSVSERKPA